MRRAKCLLEDEQYDACVRDYEKIFKENRTQGMSILLLTFKIIIYSFMCNIIIKLLHLYIFT